MIYLDNAATSWPKPDCVLEAMNRFLHEIGANPGRSGHRLANQAEAIRFDTREALAGLVGVRDPMRIVFTHNATAALNLAIRGLLTPGSHVITTGMEHNAVMRPLRDLENRGAALSLMPCEKDGSLDPEQLGSLIRPETRLIVVNHASNVCGTLLPIRRIGEIAHQHGVPLLVDAAQTAGGQPIDLYADNVALLAFTGHKSLLGPTGTGGLAIRDDFDITNLPPLEAGGTGSRSEQEYQPDFMPDKYEAGTSNIVGLAGLNAGVRYILEREIPTIMAHEQSLTQRLLNGLREIPRVRVFGTGRPRQQTAVVSFLIDGQSVSEVAHRLDEEFEIMTRPGLHCAPAAHQTLGTKPHGTIRLAPGLFTTENQIDETLAAIHNIAAGVTV